MNLDEEIYYEITYDKNEADTVYWDVAIFVKA